MTTLNPHTDTLTIATLPAVGSELDGGIFAGLITTKKGTHCAVVLLPAQGTALNWAQANEWAKEQGGELPSRPVAALLFANLRDKLAPTGHWTSESREGKALTFWQHVFSDGHDCNLQVDYNGSAVVVRLIALTA